MVARPSQQSSTQGQKYALVKGKSGSLCSGSTHDLKKSKSALFALGRGIGYSQQTGDCAYTAHGREDRENFPELLIEKPDFLDTTGFRKNPYPLRL
jgi:hypothetical protein